MQHCLLPQKIGPADTLHEEYMEEGLPQPSHGHNHTTPHAGDDPMNASYGNRGSSLNQTRRSDRSRMAGTQRAIEEQQLAVLEVCMGAAWGSSHMAAAWKLCMRGLVGYCGGSAIGTACRLQPSSLVSVIIH